MIEDKEAMAGDDRARRRCGLGGANWWVADRWRPVASRRRCRRLNGNGRFASSWFVLAPLVPSYSSLVCCVYRGQLVRWGRCQVGRRSGFRWDGGFEPLEDALVRAQSSVSLRLW